MFKTFFQIIFIIYFVILTNHIVNAKNLKIEIDKSIVDKVHKEVKFNINKLTEIDDIQQIDNIHLSVWVAGLCGLQEKDFPSKDKMNEIKNTTTLNFGLTFPKHINGVFRIAKFNSYEDSKLAWADSVVPSSGVFSNTLPSGEEIKDCEIKTIKKGSVMWVYLFHNNYLCKAIFSAGGKHIEKEYYKFIDTSIIAIKQILDEIK